MKWKQTLRMSVRKRTCFITSISLLGDIHRFDRLNSCVFRRCLPTPPEHGKLAPIATVQLCNS